MRTAHAHVKPVNQARAERTLRTHTVSAAGVVAYTIDRHGNVVSVVRTHTTSNPAEGFTVRVNARGEVSRV